MLGARGRPRIESRKEVVLLGNMELIFTFDPETGKVTGWKFKGGFPSGFHFLKNSRSRQGKRHKFSSKIYFYKIAKGKSIKDRCRLNHSRQFFFIKNSNPRLNCNLWLLIYNLKIWIIFRYLRPRRAARLWAIGQRKWRKIGKDTGNLFFFVLTRRRYGITSASFREGKSWRCFYP